jgi:hypothetical protein
LLFLASGLDFDIMFTQALFNHTNITITNILNTDLNIIPNVSLPRINHIFTTVTNPIFTLTNPITKPQGIWNAVLLDQAEYMKVQY